MKQPYKKSKKRPVTERVKDFCEVELCSNEQNVIHSVSRCMDCGVPFCHSWGCPLANLIPDFNNMVYHGQWRKALDILHSTNNFPEITGRVCPGPCEVSCVLGIEEKGVNVRQIELSIIEKGFENGWVRPDLPLHQNQKKIAVVGSGPAGLTIAQDLVRKGYFVVVFEKQDRLGGLLRYGIPDFKLEKWVIDRRIDQMKAEGVTFETNVNIGCDISIGYLRRVFDAVVLATGASTPRDLDVPGRELSGIHFALDFLGQQNKRTGGDFISIDTEIKATGKNVVIVGGGETGADCLGTCIRQNAKTVLQVEIQPRPPIRRDPKTPWPNWPNKLMDSSSHEEGGKRLWSTLIKEVVGQNGTVTGVKVSKVDWTVDGDKRPSFNESQGAELFIEADMILIAMGFTKEGNASFLNQLEINTTSENEPVVDENQMTNLPGVFVIGDLKKGPSLVVKAIQDAKMVANKVHNYLDSIEQDSTSPKMESNNYISYKDKTETNFLETNLIN